MNGTEDSGSVGALDPHEHTHLLLYTVVGREIMVECEPDEIKRFFAEVSTPENMANGGAGLTLTTKFGDALTLLAGLDAVQRLTRATVEEANRKAKEEREQQAAREHVLLSGARRTLVTPRGRS